MPKYATKKTVSEPPQPPPAPEKPKKPKKEPPPPPKEYRSSNQCPECGVLYCSLHDQTRSKKILTQLATDNTVNQNRG